MVKILLIERKTLKKLIKQSIEWNVKQTKIPNHKTKVPICRCLFKKLLLIPMFSLKWILRSYCNDHNRNVFNLCIITFNFIKSLDKSALESACWIIPAMTIPWSHFAISFILLSIFLIYSGFDFASSILRLGSKASLVRNCFNL